MADQSTQSITIDAAPDAVMAVIADFANYPVWTGSVKKAEVLETGSDGRAKRVAFTLDAGVIRDEYELEYQWSKDTKVEWNLVSGQMMRAQQGSYVLERRRRRHAGHVLTDRRPGHPDARPAQAQGRAGRHGHRAQGTQEARRSPAA